MLRSGAFWLGAGAGALVAWMVLRRQSALLAATPHGPIPIRRDGRRGRSWPGGVAYNL